MSKNLHVLHIAEIKHIDKNGNILWEDKNLHNLLHDEGEQYILSCAFATGMANYGVAPANLYLGLDTSTRTLAEADTLALVTENIEANGYTRKSLSTAGDGSATADFYITQPATYFQAQSKIMSWTCVNNPWTTVTKLFLTTASSGTTGRLICSVALSATRTLAVGDVISAAIYIGMSE